MIGHATLPWEYGESDLRHGVAIHHGTLPGGGMVTLNLGDNAVHEVILLVLKRFKHCIIKVIA